MRRRRRMALGARGTTAPPADPITLDALIDVVLGMPMCASSEEGQQKTGGAFCTAFFKDLETFAAKGEPERALAESVRQAVWAASRGFASLRKFFEEHKAYRMRLQKDREDFVRGFAGLDKLNAAGWLARLGAGAAGLLVPATLDWVINRTSGAPPIDSAMMSAIFDAAKTRGDIATATPLSPEIVTRLDGLIATAAERAAAPGPLAALAQALTSPAVLASLFLGVFLAAAFVVGLDLGLRWWAHGRIVAIEKETAQSIDDDWLETRERYGEVLGGFIRSVARSKDRYRPGSTRREVIAIIGQSAPVSIAWHDEGLAVTLAAVANAKMQVYPPDFSKQRAKHDDAANRS